MFYLGCTLKSALHRFENRYIVHFRLLLQILLSFLCRFWITFAHMGFIDRDFGWLLLAAIESKDYD